MSAINLQTFAERAWLFAKFSELAYLNPKLGINAYKELGYTAIFVDHDGSQAYLLVNEFDIVVVCRGTEPTQFKDIAADLDTRLVDSKAGDGRVHAGFRESCRDVWPAVVEFMIKHQENHAIWCTGHSLGAAMATLIAHHLSSTNTVTLFTYGSPRVGDRGYINLIKNSVVHYRFINNMDIVTRVPGWPYKHFGDIIYMNHEGLVCEMTTAQVVKDRIKGLIKGLAVREINYFTNHSISRYVKNLELWKYQG